MTTISTTSLERSSWNWLSVD